jgi:plastocyanin
MVAISAVHDIVGAMVGTARQLVRECDMRGLRLIQAMVITALVAGCGGGSMATDPGTNPITGGTGGGTGGGTSGGSGGNVGGGSGGGPVSTAVTITVGNDFFRSDRNGSVNTAVDTITAGGTVTWRWGNTGSVPHSVESILTPSFASSAIQSGSGSSYEQTFTTPGTYRYNCAVHGSLMTGIVVVVAP